MARVTVEDCIKKITNRFELVMLAAQRARNISAGADLTLDRDNDKNPIVALREIAEDRVELDRLEAALVQGLQRHIEVDEPDDEEMDLLAIKQELAEDMAPIPDPEHDGDQLAVVDDESREQEAVAETPPAEDEPKE